MYRKLFGFILFVCSVVSISAQDAPKSDGDPKTGVTRFYSMAIGGPGSYLGVELDEVSSRNYAQLGLSEVRGVAIAKVSRDSPAEKSGLQDGDVIVGFNGESVTSSRKLMRLIGEVAPDHTVTLTIVRNGGEIEIPVTMGERKTPVLFSGDFNDPPMAPLPPTIVIPNLPDIPSAPSAPFPPVRRVFV